MIVDTSALVAVAMQEDGADQLLEAIGGGGSLPAPAYVEFIRVMSKRGAVRAAASTALINDLIGCELVIDPFTAEDARLAADANVVHGTGNSRGGTLNLLDLMVYAIAKRTGRPILCTGKDFASTDADIHPASRRW